MVKNARYQRLPANNKVQRRRTKRLRWNRLLADRLFAALFL